MSREHLDRIAKAAVRRHRERRLGLYLEAVLADYVEHFGVAETRRRLQQHIDHLKEFG